MSIEDVPASPRKDNLQWTKSQLRLEVQVKSLVWLSSLNLNPLPHPLHHVHVQGTPSYPPPNVPLYSNNLKSILLYSGIILPVLSTPLLQTRQSCVATCGGTCYWQSDVDAAQSKGFQLLEEGQTEGSDEYPHEYEDREGFDFPVSGPYYEFPILSSFQVYNGGSPGADRVIFNSNDEFAGLITHTGASDDDFVACQGEDI